DPIRRAYMIDINRDMRVSEIRKLLINDKKRFATINEEDLILWHVDIPTRGKDLGTTIKTEDIKGGMKCLHPQAVRTVPILKFLQVNFEKSPVRLVSITTFGHNFPLVGRITTATCLTESFISQFKAACKGGDRNECPIFISAGAPGTGKTRNLIETIPMIRSCFPDFAAIEISNEIQNLARLLDDPVQIFMTYNENFNPRNIEKTLAPDEFQRLVGSPFCKGNNDQEKRQYLKEVILALGDAMLCEFSISNIFIICHLAGTVLTPLSEVTNSFSYRHIILHTPLLLPIDINSLFEQLELTRSWWLTSLLLRAIAYEIMLPRGIEALLEYISNSISKGISLSDIDYVQAAKCARQKINVSAIPSLLAKEILVAIMLQSCVSRIDRDYYKVIMPYMYARKLVSHCGPDKSLKNLSLLFSLDVSVDGGIIDFYWANFELYCCHLQ
ncbi:10629_t:CDS:2, partial [Dentiscutata heterogama]